MTKMLEIIKTLNPPKKMLIKSIKLKPYESSFKWWISFLISSGMEAFSSIKSLFLGCLAFK